MRSHTLDREVSKSQARINNIRAQMMQEKIPPEEAIIMYRKEFGNMVKFLKEDITTAQAESQEK